MRLHANCSDSNSSSLPCRNYRLIGPRVGQQTRKVIDLFRAQGGQDGVGRHHQMGR
jgi:hypothetical protein